MPVSQHAQYKDPGTSSPTVNEMQSFWMLWHAKMSERCENWPRYLTLTNQDNQLSLHFRGFCSFFCIQRHVALTEPRQFTPLLLVLIWINFNFFCPNHADATKITLAPSNADINQGEDVTLQCHASHDPTMDLTFTWALNGVLLDLEDSAGPYHRVEGVSFGLHGEEKVVGMMLCV